jgi:hypothetical protein
MNELSVPELEAKIAMVEADIRQLRLDGGNDRKATILSEYKEYLLDELKMLKNEKTS